MFLRLFILPVYCIVLPLDCVRSQRQNEAPCVYGWFGATYSYVMIAQGCVTPHCKLVCAFFVGVCSWISEYWTGVSQWIE